MAAPEQINSTTTGTTPKLVVAADGSRQTITIQNHEASGGEDMWFSFLSSTPAIDSGWKLSPGQSRTMKQADWPQITNALYVVNTTSGKKYSITTDVN